MDINWRQLWTALGVVFAIVAGTVSITLVVTGGQIGGLERSLAQLERSQSQQAENLLAITGSQISGLERSQAQQAENILALMNAQNESVLAQLRLLNDKMNNIETEHAELRSLYREVGELQSDVNTMRANQDMMRADLNTMRADLDMMRANQDTMRANQDTMRADLDKILTILESGE